MKKILHISKYYYPFRGGTEQTAQDCVNVLKNQYKQKVICYNHRKGTYKDIIDDVEVIKVGCFAKIASQSLSISYGRYLKKIIDGFKPDIIIVHYPNPFAIHYLLKYIPKNSKLVVYWHLDIVKQKFLRMFFKSQNKKLIIRADRIFATSPNYIEGSVWLRKVKEKCRVIPSCINVNRLQVTDEVWNLCNEIKKNNYGKIICVAVGRHTEYKGFKYLIEASKYLDDRFKIFITGQGELTKTLKKQAKNDPKIQFLGLVSDIELKAYLTAMDIFCFPSITKNEAFGLALAEAMYYGKPVVTFEIKGSGVNFVSLGGITGVEVPNRDSKAYSDALLKLANDSELRKRYGQAGKERVEELLLDSQYAENIRKEIFSIL